MASGAHVEIESKFDVTSDTAVPELSLDGELTADPMQTHRLCATYFDTKDLRLTRAKITLRRRTGGSDDGWHVKLPATASGGESSARLELTFPLGAAKDAETVPDDVRHVVLGRVRDLPLLPIARIENERHETVLRRAGTPVVEFCDDHVNAQSFVSESGGGKWREWEIEWRGDNPDHDILSRLSASCHEAGAQAPSSASKLARAVGPLPEAEAAPTGHLYQVLARDLEQLLSHDPGARRGTMVGVHQARVAVRNLRSTLRTYATELNEAAATANLPYAEDHTEAELKLFAALLGKVRDVQVVRERLHHLAENYSADIVPPHVHDRIDIELDRAEKRATTRIAVAMTGTRYLDLLSTIERIRDIAAEVEDSHATEVATSRNSVPGIAMAGVDRQFKRFAKVRSRTENDLASLELTLAQREELTHIVRKRAKALRRSVQSIDKQKVPAVAPLRSACQRLHTVLGDVQDSVTARQWLRRIARSAESAGEPSFGFGVLYEAERGFSERTLSGFESEAATVTAAYRELQAAEKSTRKKSKKRKNKKKKSN